MRTDSLFHTTDELYSANHEPEVAQSAPGKPSASESPSTKRKRDTSDTGASPEKEKKAKGEVAAKAVDPAVPFADCLSAEGTMTVYVDGDPSWESLESGEVEDVVSSSGVFPPSF